MDKTSLSYTISLFGCVFAAIVVLLGAYTPLVDAGLGCPDWPGCYGFIGVPDSPEEIQIAEQAYPYAVAALLLLSLVTLVHNLGQQKTLA